MFNVRDLVKRAIIALAAPFIAAWPILVGLAEKLKVDISAGKGAALAAIAAAGAALLTVGWEWLRQLWASAKGYFPAAPEAIEAVKAAKDNAETALRLMKS